MVSEAIRSQRRMGVSVIRGFNTSSLSRALDAFREGDLREAVRYFDHIAEVDDTLPSVRPKREKSVAHKAFRVSKLEKTPAAEAQEQVLTDFWRRLNVVDAWDTNIKGGQRLLFKLAMSAVANKYAPFFLEWRPGAARLELTAHFVPLWFFENRWGELRFLRTGFGTEGAPLDPGQWEIAHGDGLMIPCSVGYAAKRLVYQDWLAFSEKFSLPALLGKTPGARDSEAGRALAAAVESFANDWAAVIYGDDGRSSIELIQANGNPAAMPQPALLERVDRKFAAMWRGADLSTMSSGGGEGSGASLQGEEADILERDDCAALSEFCQRIERRVLDWHFGPDAETLARGELACPVREDQTSLLSAVTTFHGLGVRLPVADLLRRFALSEADRDELALGERSTTTDPVPAANAEAPVTDLSPGDDFPGDPLIAAAAQLIAEARADSARPLEARLRAILLEEDAPKRKRLMQALSRRLPTMIDDFPQVADAWEAILATAYVDGLDDAGESKSSGEEGTP